MEDDTAKEKSTQHLNIQGIYTSNMTTDMITMKLEHQFLEKVDKAVKHEGYHNRTEFIRTALREKLDKIQFNKAVLEIAHLKGKAKKKVSAEEYESARTKAFEALERES